MLMGILAAHERKLEQLSVAMEQMRLEIHVKDRL